ncbi:MAG TPA: phage tail protein [Mesorhizobium sp.]|jgi:phage-related protein|nr:phage tail protein [Mesorhizobium sp.]
MPFPSFTPPLSPSSVEFEPELKLNEVEFGDGYTQTTAAGMNHLRQVATLNWELLEPAEKADLVAFLTARKGFETFTYTIPGEATALNWTCKQWSVQARPASLYSLTATFRQSFEL